jgi:hypothetical protein
LQRNIGAWENRISIIFEVFLFNQVLVRFIIEVENINNVQIKWKTYDNGLVPYFVWWLPVVPS